VRFAFLDGKVFARAALPTHFYVVNAVFIIEHWPAADVWPIFCVMLIDWAGSGRVLSDL